jgi:hypothetical protein
METLAGAHSLLGALHARGVDLTTLGAAYLALLGNTVITLALFLAARTYLVISPNRAARDYAVYVSAVLATLLVATALENELLAPPLVTLQYVAIPQLLILMAIHLSLSYKQRPWLVALGASSIAGAVLTVAIAGLFTHAVRMAHWLTLLLLTGLLGFLWFKSISTKRGFVSAKSIYVGSKESFDDVATPQKPWLGLTQWVALIVASTVLATLNSLLRGRELGAIPAVDVATETGLLMVITAAVAAVPAVCYWLTRKNWMPQLTRLVWLVWIVVGFAFTYGNYLSLLTGA